MEHKYRAETSIGLPTFYKEDGSVDHRMVWKVWPEEGDWSTLRVELWDNRTEGEQARLVSRQTFYITDLSIGSVVKKILTKAEQIAQLARVVDAVADVYA